MLNLELKLLFNMLFIFLLFMAGSFFSMKNFSDSKKLSPFECGFNPRLNSRGAFSLQFFLVAIIFIIFDVELILLYPYLSIGSTVWSYFTNCFYMLFLMMLSLGLVMEWNQQMLNWLI